MSVTPDLLAALADEQAAGPLQTRTLLLASARRQITPIRRTFVQASAGTPAVLAALVSARKHRAVATELLLLAFEPILDKTPLHAAAWGRALSPDSGPLVTAQSMSKTWAELADYRLVDRAGRVKRLANVVPLCEDGSGAAYTRPGKSAAGTTGYFGLPNTYWTAGWDQRLSLPGKAMLLILLSATTKRPTLNSDYEEIARRFGISERTARRGCGELMDNGLMGVHGQLVAAPRSPNGITTRYHRFLTDPFSPETIAAMRKADVAAARAKQSAGEPSTASTKSDSIPASASLFEGLLASQTGGEK